jgi:hypothetical protein
MISEDFMREVKAFIGLLGKLELGYQLKYDEEIKSKVLDHYLPAAQAQTEEIKRRCLEIMKKSCVRNSDHAHIGKWKGALLNIIVFCIIPTTSFHEVEERQKKPYDFYKEAAISSVIRFSRWYHDDCNLWNRFKPYAEQIVELLWGDIEVLNKYNE